MLLTSLENDVRQIGSEIFQCRKLVYDLCVSAKEKIFFLSGMMISNCKISFWSDVLICVR